MTVAFAFGNVLVGVDGRQGGRDAVALARRVVGPEGKLTLAHVHSGRLRSSRALTAAMLSGERESSIQLLARERAAAELDCELVSVEALSPSGGLHRQARLQDADLLVVGSCSHGALGRALLGDDARAALGGASCAVAIARAGYAEHPFPFARIGVAYNRSAESELALETARLLAAPTRASVEALEVVSVPAPAYTGLMPPLGGDGADAMLREASSALERLPGVQGRAVYGLAGEELAAFAEQVDLLVLGSRGHGPVKRLVLGSTCEYLERHAHCSMLVLPRATVAVDGCAAEHEQGSETCAGAA